MTVCRVCVVASLLVVLTSLTATVAAQPLHLPAQHAPPAAPEPDAEDRAAPDSPRASIVRYLDLCRRQRWVDAARFLDLPRGMGNAGPTLARELYDVLDRFIDVDPETVSSDAQGDPDDGLPPRVDQLGQIPDPDGTPRAVRIVRKDLPDGSRWIFSRETVSRVDGWYSRLGGRWAREHLPPWLLRRGPRDILGWQWLGLLVIAAGAWAGGRVLGWLTRTALARLARRAHGVWRPALARAAAPLTAFWTLALVSLGADWLSLYRAAEEFVNSVVRAGFYGVFFVGLWRAAEVLAHGLGDTPWVRGHPSSVTLIPLATRFAKVVVAVIAVIAVLSQLGYPVASLLAGLGIGGLALALAAQKTGEHLFGSIAIGVDQPFRVGDFVKVDGFSGSVESVGLRSTQIRTLDRTVITLPNGKLADMSIETFAPRDRMRLACTLSLHRGTRPAQVRAVIAGVQAVLTGHPTAWREAPTVALKAISDTSLDIDVIAWFATTRWDQFVTIRQDVLLAMLDVIEREGTSLAHPEHTVRIVGDPPPAPNP